MESRKDPHQESFKTFFLLLLGILIIWIISGGAILITFKDWHTQGQFGDMFGAINSLFSGFAFAGIIYTILLQKKELFQQRIELIETRKELARTASAQEKSENALHKQAENLKTSAKLEALNSLVNYYTDLEKRLVGIGSPHIGEVGRKRDYYLKSIETILKAEEDL